MPVSGPGRQGCQVLNLRMSEISDFVDLHCSSLVILCVGVL